MATQTGLDRLLTDRSLQQKCKGRVAYLCHNASVDTQCREGLALMHARFGTRLKAIFSPQHGLFAEAQDNMIESGHFLHPFFNIPVHSLYSETRRPTPVMLDGIDQIIVDLQDVGCRAYTFVYTMTLLFEACGERDIEVLVLDRPNPLGGEVIEGNLLDPAFKSFIGLYPIPMRHGLTIGELAGMAIRHWGVSCSLQVIPMQGWQRNMYFGETKLPWVYPSPNMPHPKTTLVFPGAVLFEGTQCSEGRGTTRPFELFGHPALAPHALLPRLTQRFRECRLEGFSLRPTYFQPTFDKHTGTACGGYQIHVMNRARFRPWATGQVLLQEIRHALGDAFEWRQPPFEYETVLLPIDLLNGTDQLRYWVDDRGDYETLLALEQSGRAAYLEQRESVLLYP